MFHVNQDISVDYVPQVGYLVAVKGAEVHKLQHPITNPTVPASSTGASMWDQGGQLGEGIAALPYGESGYQTLYNPGVTATAATAAAAVGFEFIYAQDGVHYFKHPIVMELDDSLGDLKSEIIDRQRQLLLQIEDAVLDAEAQLQQLSTTVSSFDALISLGVIAVEQNLTAPTIIDQATVIIKGGRHLLQELTVDNFVANDAFLSGDRNVGLITGPNNSGEETTVIYLSVDAYSAATFRVFLICITHNTSGSLSLFLSLIMIHMTIVAFI